MTKKSMNRAARSGRSAEDTEANVQAKPTNEQAEGPQAQTAGPARIDGGDTAPSLLAAMRPPRETKTLALRRRLQAPGGATLASLMEATGWQAHTVRAALSGLRKKGWAVTRKVEGAGSVYLIDPAAPIPPSETDVIWLPDDPVEGGPEQDGAAPDGAGA